MSGFLDQMSASSEARLEAGRRLRPIDDLIAASGDHQTRKLPETGFLTVAEIKPASPSEGSFPDRDPVELAIAYEEAGASAISVLTEPSVFGGSLELLNAVRASVGIPVMRKDFLIDPYQVWEARVAGADGVLAIVRMIDDRMLAEIVEAADLAGMFVLVEIFEAEDASRVWSLPNLDRLLIGVNSRDLETLEIRPNAHERLLEDLPDGPRRIAESGLGDAQAVELVAGLGYDGVLVGSALMRSGSPPELLRSLVAAGASTS